MAFLTSKRKQLLLNVGLAVVFAVGLWYMVIGSEQLETQVEIRLEYRGLGENLVVRDGMINRIAVRLRGSQELLRTLNNRDLTYTVDLSGLSRGAHVLPLDLSTYSDLRAYDIVEISPARLVLEIDAITEKSVPLTARIAPLDEDALLRLSHVLLEPDSVTVRGPESDLSELNELTVNYNPNQDLVEGNKVISLAIGGPPQVSITPPVTSLYYTLVATANELNFERIVQLDGFDDAEYLLVPDRVNLIIDVPDDRLDDAEYLAGVRVVALPSGNLEPGQSETAPVFVLLPQGARLVEVEPSQVAVHRLLEGEANNLASPESEAALRDIVNGLTSR